jgi:hypothetical protein
MMIFLNIVFDNLIRSKEELQFFNWFGSVNTGIELIKQVKAKYNYNKNNK